MGLYVVSIVSKAKNEGTVMDPKYLPTNKTLTTATVLRTQNQPKASKHTKNGEAIIRRPKNESGFAN